MTEEFFVFARDYGLAESKALPLFHMGREICARKSTLQKWVAAKEAGGWQ